MRRLWNILISIDLCVWLLAVLCLSMATGTFSLTGEYGSAINSMPLYYWLTGTPLTYSWWLWLSIIVMAKLAVATVACTFEAIRLRLANVNIISLLAPQLIHAGFLLIAAAHLMSAFGSSNQQVEVVEGSFLRLPDNSTFRVAKISTVLARNGMPIGFSSELLTDPEHSMSRTTISPNHPWFSGKYGVYIKQAENYPYPRALLEIHQEPGAGLALAGGIIFTIGNLLVLWFRSKRGENSC